MNLDQEEKKKKSKDDANAPVKKKLTRKEKKALKKAEALSAAAEAEAASKAAAEEISKSAEKEKNAESEEVDAKLDPSPVEEIPPPKYSTWEKISPPARRKKQISNMESGFREVLALVHSMRNNQEVLLEAFEKLPEAVDSVKKLADHSAQQSDLLKAMNDQIGTGSAGQFNKTLSSMDQTTQLLLERAQRSEEQLFGMLKSAQRRIAFMTLLVLMLFLGAVAVFMFVFFPEKVEGVLNRSSAEPASISQESSVSVPTPEKIMGAVESMEPSTEPEPSNVAEPEVLEEVPEEVSDDILEESNEPVNEEISSITESTESVADEAQEAIDLDEMIEKDVSEVELPPIETPETKDSVEE